jgi:hypothetical protein
MRTCKNFLKLMVTEDIFVLLVLSLCFSGCAHPGHVAGISRENEPNIISIYAQYAPSRIDILPLTEFSINKESRKGEINLYIRLLDSYGSEIKSPCIFRFELYTRIERSSQGKGRRVNIWPDMNLIDVKTNNEYWQGFLRAYEFHLPFEAQPGQPYILEVTCMCLNNTRITTEFSLKTTE